MNFKLALQFIFVTLCVCILSSFISKNDKSPSPELKYYLKHMETLLKDGGKWKTPNREYKAEDEFSPSYYGYEYTKGINDYYLKLKITAYYPKKMNWYVLSDGFYTWDFIKNSALYFSASNYGANASGIAESITENNFVLAFTITMPDGKQIKYKETETFKGDELVTQNSEWKENKWGEKKSSTWTRQELPPQDLKIVYNAVLDKTCGTYEVFTMNIDGTEKKNISNWKGADWAYATFGDKIYFVSDRDTTSRLWFLYEMDFNGNNIRKVYKYRLEDSYVSVNSNGSKMIVKPIRKERNTFMIIDVASGKEIDSLKLPLAGISDPIYHNGDKQIVFRGSKEKKVAEELYIMNSDGKELKQLTNYPKSDTTAKWYETHSGTPVWNSREKTFTYFSKQKNNHSIYSVKPDGTESKRLTDDSFNEGWHAWSQDGKFLVFDGSDLQDKNFDIYLMTYDGSFIRRLTTDSIVEQAPLFIKTRK